MNTSELSRYVRAGFAALMMSGLVAGSAAAQANSQFSTTQLVAAGNNFFGQVAGNVASVIENAIGQFGLPNGYILGQTVGGAFIGGIRYGEGTLYTQNIGSFPIFWQGPSIGFDIGADASQTMMLVYNLPSIEGLFRRFPSVAGQAYAVGGVGVSVMSNGGTTIVNIVSGVGARLGISIGYLRFTSEPTWNPF